MVVTKVSVCPSPLIASCDPPIGTPLLTETILVVGTQFAGGGTILTSPLLKQVSRTNTCPAGLPPLIRFVAFESNATKRPSALMALRPELLDPLTGDPLAPIEIVVVLGGFVQSGWLVDPICISPKS